jgi:transposase
VEQESCIFDRAKIFPLFSIFQKQNRREREKRERKMKRKRKREKILRQLAAAAAGCSRADVTLGVFLAGFSCF